MFVFSLDFIKQKSEKSYNYEQNLNSVKNK